MQLSSNSHSMNSRYFPNKGILNIKSSLRYTQSNGMVKRAAQTMKKKKTLKGNTEQWRSKDGIASITNNATKKKERNTFTSVSDNEKNLHANTSHVRYHKWTHITNKCLAHK